MPETPANLGPRATERPAVGTIWWMPSLNDYASILPTLFGGRLVPGHPDEVVAIIGEYIDFDPFTDNDERTITWFSLREVPDDALPPWADRFAVDVVELVRKASR